MIDTPTIVEVPRQDLAVIHLTVTLAEMMKVFGPAIGEVVAALQAQGAAPAGPVVAHHHRNPSDTFDFDVGFPVAAPIQPAGRVKPAVRAAATLARCVHTGGYEELDQAWRAFHAWLDAQKVKTGTELWETYLVGPEGGGAASSYRTELARPVVP